MVGQGGDPLRVMRQGRPEGLYPGEVRMKQNRKKWKNESHHVMVRSSLETPGGHQVSADWCLQKGLPGDTVVRDG